jgi:uncharacterized CHY-type Zn-finger protein
MRCGSCEKQLTAEELYYYEGNCKTCEQEALSHFDEESETEGVSLNSDVNEEECIMLVAILHHMSDDKGRFLLTFSESCFCWELAKKRPSVYSQREKDEIHRIYTDYFSVNRCDDVKIIICANTIGIIKHKYYMLSKKCKVQFLRILLSFLKFQIKDLRK